MLYGSRRTYLKKVAVAEWDGVTANTTFVLEAVEGRLLQKLLPWLMISDRFTKHSVQESKGSTNPYINWPDIAKFEFDLPPLDQQRRIAEMLWAVDEEEQKWTAAAEAARKYLNAVTESTLEGMFRADCETLATMWTASPDSGCSAPPSSIETGHYVLSLAAVSHEGYRRGNLKPVEPTPVMLDAKLRKGDFLISRSNTPELVGLVGIFDEDRDDVSFPDTMMRLHIDEARILKPFLEVVLLSIRGRRHMMKSAAGTSGSMKKINRQTLGPCVVPTPPLSQQQAFLEELDGPLHAVRASGSASASARSVKEALTNGFLP